MSAYCHRRSRRYRALRLDGATWDSRRSPPNFLTLSSCTTRATETGHPPRSMTSQERYCGKIAGGDKHKGAVLASGNTAAAYGHRDPTILRNKSTLTCRRANKSIRSASRCESLELLSKNIWSIYRLPSLKTNRSSVWPMTSTKRKENRTVEPRRILAPSGGLCSRPTPRHSRFFGKTRSVVIYQTMSLILLTVLIVLLVGALPTWPYSSGWGYYPSGGLGLILIILLILLLMGRI